MLISNKLTISCWVFTTTKFTPKNRFHFWMLEYFFFDNLFQWWRTPHHLMFFRFTSFFFTSIFWVFINGWINFLDENILWVVVVSGLCLVPSIFQKKNLLLLPSCSYTSSFPNKDYIDWMDIIEISNMYTKSCTFTKYLFHFNRSAFSNRFQVPPA